MSTRSQSRIRRDINRLQEVVALHREAHPVLEAMATQVNTLTAQLNAHWKAYQEVSLRGNRERQERAQVVEKLRAWLQQWRPVVLINVPGAEANLRKLPTRAATPDDLLRAVEDLRDLIHTKPTAAPFREGALHALGTLVDDARREVQDATVVLSEEKRARQDLRESSHAANTLVAHTMDILRSLFGKSSPEYRQFLTRTNTSEKNNEEGLHLSEDNTTPEVEQVNAPEQASTPTELNEKAS